MASASLTAMLHTAEEECGGWQESQLGTSLTLILGECLQITIIYKEKSIIESQGQIRRHVCYLKDSLKLQLYGY